MGLSSRPRPPRPAPDTPNPAPEAPAPGGPNAAPALYDARVRHQRTRRIRRGFEHRVYLWLVDIDRPPRLPGWLAPFARFEARDHRHVGDDPNGTVRGNLTDWLATQGAPVVDGPILMLANARCLGHVFNPISLFWCFGAEVAGAHPLQCVVAEVHNTYGGRHRYLLRPDADGRAETTKQFYVSPFLPMGGRYRMRVPVPGPELGITIALEQDGRPALTATLTGTRVPATTTGLVRMLLRRPLVTRRTSALIRRHGIALWLRRLPVYPRTTAVPAAGPSPGPSPGPSAAPAGAATPRAAVPTDAVKGNR